MLYKMTAIFSLNKIAPQDDLIWRHDKDIGLPSDNFKVDYIPDDETIFEYWMVPPPPTSIWEEQSIFSMCDDPSIFSIDENDVCQGFVNQQFQKKCANEKNYNNDNKLLHGLFFPKIQYSGRKNPVFWVAYKHLTIPKFKQDLNKWPLM